MKLHVAVVTAVAAGFLCVSAPAAAEVRGRIVGIEARDGELQVSFSVAGLGTGQVVDPTSAELTLDGRPLQVSASLASATSATRIARRVMLTIDTSGSMAGPGIVGARAAAAAYLAQVPRDVEVGLITFDDDARLVVPLTRDRVPVRAAVSRLEASGNTALYDAVTLASRSFPKTGNHQILLLSDGADDGSSATLPQAATALKKADVALNSVIFRNAEVTSALDKLTAAAGGRLLSTEQTAELSEAFTEAATNTSNDIVLKASLPADFGGTQGTVLVTAVAAGQALSDSALAVGLRQPVPSAAPRVAAPLPAELAPAILRSSATLYLALALLFLGVLAVVGTAVGSIGTRDRVSGRLAIYTLGGRSGRRSAEASGEGGNAVSRSVRNIADRVVQRRDLEARLALRLDAGGVPLKPAEWLMLHVGLVLCVPLLVLVLTGGDMLLTLLSLVFATLGPWGYLGFKKRQRTRAFLAQLPDVLQLMSGSLSAGYSLPQAVDAVVREGTEPVAPEFNKALVEARIGAPIEDALEDVATRMQSVDFSWVVMAIRIQREVGGNLAEILSTVAATLRERERLRRQVQVLSAEGRLSAWILGALPVAFGLYLLLTRREYLTPLVTDPIGWLLIGTMVVLMVVGSFWMKKVVTVDV